MQLWIASSAASQPSRNAVALYRPSSAAPKGAEQQAHHEQDQRDKEDRLGDLDRRTGDAAKSEQRGDQADNQECDHPVEHCVTSFNHCGSRSTVDQQFIAAVRGSEPARIRQIDGEFRNSGSPTSLLARTGRAAPAHFPEQVMAYATNAGD